MPIIKFAVKRQWCDNGIAKNEVFVPKIWRGVRYYVQCGCTVLSKIWRLVGCTKMVSRSISCYTSWLSPPPPSWVSWSRSCIWSELEVAETIRVDVAEVVALEEKLEVSQLVEDHTHTQKIKWIGRAILMNDELRIARLKIALQRPFLGRAILIFTQNIAECHSFPNM